MTLPRFYPVLDTMALQARGIAPVEAAKAVLEAGARILQIRHKGDYTRAAFSEAEEIAALCRQARALLIINDRADIASLLGAGVHLGQDDLPPRHTRAIGGAGMIIGFSTHNEEQLTASADEPVDYVALGPIFGTSSKQNPDPVIGTAELGRLRPITGRPLVAIGGITMDNASEVLAAGADSVAVIGDLLGGVNDTRELRSRTEEWLRLTNRQKR